MLEICRQLAEKIFDRLFRRSSWFQKLNSSGNPHRHRKDFSKYIIQNNRNIWDLLLGNKQIFGFVKYFNSNNWESVFLPINVDLETLGKNCIWI